MSAVVYIYDGSQWTAPGRDPIDPPDPPDDPPASGGTEPTADTTGPDPDVTLTDHDGDLVATDDVSALHITGSLYLAASGITATDCQVDGSVYFSATANKGYAVPVLTNQTIVRVWCRGVWTTGCDGLTMTSCRIGPSLDTDMQLTAYQVTGGDYLNAENITVTDCYFHPPLASTGTRHLQAVHLMGCHHVLFDNCAFDYVIPDQDTRVQTTAAFFVQAYPKQCEDVTLDSCAFYGGGYYQISIDTTDGMTVTDCRFHSFTSTGGGTGAIQYPPKTTVTASGNTLDGDPYTWVQPAGA